MSEAFLVPKHFPAGLFEKVKDWISHDPDPATKEQLEELLLSASDPESSEAKAALSELKQCFAGPLQFGTAGLRGKIGPGESRMNRAVVIRAAAGLSKVLFDELGPGFKVVIGNDARFGSRQFALDTAAVVTAAGGDAYLLPTQLPTPVLAFATRYLQADAGVMVTASHNPPADNGYKVYLGGRIVSGDGQGAQIVPPYDQKISDAIASCPAANHIERAEEGWRDLGPELLDAYLKNAEKLAAKADRSDLKIVHTSMHGVGSYTTKRAFMAAGFTNFHEVAAQKDPDPTFPTVSFPNPEEPGALDLALAMAKEVSADLVLANDPDADRCSAAIKDKDGTWRQLTGDEIGALLGQQVAKELAGEKNARLACSLVSSRLLAAIASEHELEFSQTLTGFKWISRAPQLRFGYEEAIGFCVDPAHVRDKDGISASLKLADLAWHLHREGKTLQDALDDIYRRHGVYLTSQISVRVEDLSLIGKIMEKMRMQAPKTLLGQPVVESFDLLDGYNGLLPTDGVLFRTATDTRVVVRPSGTEPKAKCYLEVVVPVKGKDVETAKASAQEAMARLRSEMSALLTV